MREENQTWWSLCCEKYTCKYVTTYHFYWFVVSAAYTHQIQQTSEMPLMLWWYNTWSKDYFSCIVLNIYNTEIKAFPQGSTFVGTGSGAPEVPELPSARGYSRATQPQGDINSGDWSSRLGVGRRANTPASLRIYCSETQRSMPDGFEETTLETK
jgi:hypothetical protein